MEDDKDQDARQERLRNVEPPEWLEELLSAARVSVDFQRRCREAATLARNINEHRDANVEMAPQRGSLRQRVSRIAAEAGVPLERVLEWYGVKNLSLADRDEDLARFCLGMGFAKDEFMNYIMVSEALAKGHLIPVASRGSRWSVGDFPWDQATLRRFRSLKDAIDAEFTQGE